MKKKELQIWSFEYVNLVTKIPFKLALSLDSQAFMEETYNRLYKRLCRLMHVKEIMVRMYCYTLIKRVTHNYKVSWLYYITYSSEFLAETVLGKHVRVTHQSLKKMRMRTKKRGL